MGEEKAAPVIWRRRTALEVGTKASPAGHERLRWAARSVLPESDTLHTIAEVGIAIAGFAGIVAAIDRRATSLASGAHGPLAVLLGSSLGAVLFAFVPEWIDAAAASPAAVWQTSNGLFGVYRLAYVAAIFASIRQAEVEAERWRLLPFGALLGGLHLVAAVGFLGSFAYFIYFTGLLWGLGMALLSFNRLIRRATATSPTD